jgi:hypothetical protein
MGAGTFDGHIDGRVDANASGGPRELGITEGPVQRFGARKSCSSKTMWWPLDAASTAT